MMIICVQFTEKTKRNYVSTEYVESGAVTNIQVKSLEEDILKCQKPETVFPVEKNKTFQQ